MSDPAGIAAAAVRAHMLLCEGHQPLTMTPGDLRTLLGRYQHRLQELADAVEPVTPVAGAGSDARLLIGLPVDRPGDYHISVCEGARADGLKPGTKHDLQSRLTDLPAGHPSSPYNEDGSRKPPVPRLQDIDPLSERQEDAR